ncbi:hypothetical protein EA658_18915 [Pseudoxanthomonas winnipegensis]|jgi:hypothetical protein|uniref:Lipoprotein SmpA/OmlA domain-containing protein n=1 Tax=Pseudoxanthomonas winnipegensis TaxID=2480810 RepID=A0ABY1WA85_9GAMM|nr:hypothetical protein [Pseudoxanthomonas winnipegensis]TAA08744.1 hypothetical protein EA659_12900 [Pseudoxanthomonas winnipegensis]TAA17110.1 hypothetical protein EA658_18915 [Pseudoxanthomonas winnipegensis]TAH71901.1 hypothetical protein EA657_12325 [Pseudoxanthomonas winnipegensis]WJI17373.1 hypothetical protein MWN52_09095 [Pseudoxanthomonas winnipegensis]
MKPRMRLLSLIALAALAGPSGAETLLVDRARDPASNLPVRGLTTGQVEARFGAPQQRLDPRGGQKRQWPTINRWVYPNFTVYFEKNKVIDVVTNKASPSEIGPKPPIR